MKHLSELMKRKAINMAKIENLLMISFFFFFFLSFDRMEKNKVVGD